MAEEQVKKSKLFSIKYIFHDFMRLNGIPGLLVFRPKKIFVSPKAKEDYKTQLKGGALLISNHISLLDPMYLMLAIWKRRHHFVATKELFEGKAKHILFTYMFLAICIDRENFSLATLKTIINHLKAGELVSIFPEGHVNVDGKGVNEFKGGMVVMALKSGTPIIPVYIKKREYWYSRLVVGIGEAINVKDFQKGPVANVNDIKEAAEYLRKQEEEIEKVVYKKK